MLILCTNMYNLKNQKINDKCFRWTKHHELLVKCNLRKEVFLQIVKTNHPTLRYCLFIVMQNLFLKKKSNLVRKVLFRICGNCTLKLHLVLIQLLTRMHSSRMCTARFNVSGGCLSIGRPPDPEADTPL